MLIWILGAATRTIHVLLEGKACILQLLGTSCYHREVGLAEPPWHCGEEEEGRPCKQWLQVTSVSMCPLVHVAAKNEAVAHAFNSNT